MERHELVEEEEERCELGGGGREARAGRWRWWRGASWEVEVVERRELEVEVVERCKLEV